MVPIEYEKHDSVVIFIEIVGTSELVIQQQHVDR